LLDYAVRTYKSELEEIDRRRILPEVQEALQSNVEIVSVSDDKTQIGWALRYRKPSTRFSPAVQQYLKEKFNEGEQTGIKYTLKWVKMVKNRFLTISKAS
jgi:hypothetical protein